MDDRPQAAVIELTAIHRYSSGLVATFESGPHIWQVEIDGADLWSFKRFRDAAQTQLGVFVVHESQELWRHDFQRQALWDAEIRRAFCAGDLVA